MVPFGKGSGVGLLNGNIMTEEAVVNFKSKDLFTTKFWANVGLTPPVN